ncbi:MAG: cytochrome C [Desulfuromonas sp.]|nr:MAG: cytochrome C [Desulfuromonas sp.]
MRQSILATLLILYAATPLMATEVPTVELGQKLFESTLIGSNGNSCSGCHPDGKGLEEIDAYDDGMLKEMTNFCIRDALKGEMMDLESTEIESFLLYLRKLHRSMQPKQ